MNETNFKLEMKIKSDGFYSILFESEYKNRGKILFEKNIKKLKNFLKRY